MFHVQCDRLRTHTQAACGLIDRPVDSLCSRSLVTPHIVILWSKGRAISAGIGLPSDAQSHLVCVIVAKCRSLGTPVISKRSTLRRNRSDHHAVSFSSDSITCVYIYRTIRRYREERHIIGRAVCKPCHGQRSACMGVPCGTGVTICRILIVWRSGVAALLDHNNGLLPGCQGKPIVYDGSCWISPLDCKLSITSRGCAHTGHIAHCWGVRSRSKLTILVLGISICRCIWEEFVVVDRAIGQTAIAKILVLILIAYLAVHDYRAVTSADRHRAGLTNKQSARPFSKGRFSNNQVFRISPLYIHLPMRNLSDDARDSGQLKSAAATSATRWKVRNNRHLDVPPFILIESLQPGCLHLAFHHQRR